MHRELSKIQQLLNSQNDEQRQLGKELERGFRPYWSDHPSDQSIIDWIRTHSSFVTLFHFGMILCEIEESVIELHGDMRRGRAYTQGVVIEIFWCDKDETFIYYGPKQNRE